MKSNNEFLRYGNFIDVLTDQRIVDFEELNSYIFHTPKLLKFGNMGTPKLLKFGNMGKIWVYNSKSIFIWNLCLYLKSFKQLRDSKYSRFKNMWNFDIDHGTIFSDILTLQPVTQNWIFRQLVPFDFAAPQSVPHSESGIMSERETKGN